MEIETGNGTFLGVSPRQMSDAGTGDDDTASGNTRRKWFFKADKNIFSKIFHDPVYWAPHLTPCQLKT